MKQDHIKVTKTTVILDTDTAELKSQCKSSLLDSYIFGNCPKFSLGKKVVKVCALLPLYFLVVKDLSHSTTGFFTAHKGHRLLVIASV